MVRTRRNCHRMSTIKYQDDTDKTARIARTNWVSRLEVSTSSHGVVGIAPRTCRNSISFPLPLGSRADAPDATARRFSEFPRDSSAALPIQVPWRHAAPPRPAPADRQAGADAPPLEWVGR